MTTHLYMPGSRNGIRLAATRQEIMAVPEPTSGPDIHRSTHGVPIPLEELQAAGTS